MDFNLNFHPLDNLIKDKTLFWLEALVPFIDYKYKKYLILYIKYKEVTALLNALEDISFVESCGFNCKAHNIDDVINGLTGFMPKDFSNNITQIKSMIDMMNVMNSMEGDGLSSIFSPINNQTSPNEDNPYYRYNSPGESDYYNNQTSNDSDLLESILTILDQEQ